MRIAALFAVLIVVAAFTAGCARGSAALLYCLVNDHDINRRCQ